MTIPASRTASSERAGAAIDDARSRLVASGAEDQPTSAMRCGGRGPATAVIRMRSWAAPTTRGLHVGEDRPFRSRSDNRRREPCDVDVRSPSAPSPILDRKHCDDLVSTDEPPVAERHHADVGGSDVFFGHDTYCSERVFAFAASRASLPGIADRSAAGSGRSLGARS